jgi:hypothetical protein
VPCYLDIESQQKVLHRFSPQLLTLLKSSLQFSQVVGIILFRRWKRTGRATLARIEEKYGVKARDAASKHHDKYIMATHDPADRVSRVRSKDTEGGATSRGGNFVDDNEKATGLLKECPAATMELVQDGSDGMCQLCNVTKQGRQWSKVVQLLKNIHPVLKRIHHHRSTGSAALGQLAHRCSACAR